PALATPAGPLCWSASSASVPSAHMPSAPCIPAIQFPARPVTFQDLPPLLFPRLLLLPRTLRRCSRPPAASPHSPPLAPPTPPLLLLPLHSLPAAAPRSLPALSD